MSAPLPAVSVIVPNYNHARFLPRRLESVLGQTFGDIEIIILDDCSTDASREVIARYLGDPRVSFYLNEANSGSPFFQWKRGLELARADLVWIAESDDFASPDFLATLVPQMLAHPEVGLGYCQSWRVDEHDRTSGLLDEDTRFLDPDRWRTGFVNCGRDECARFLIWSNTVPNASAVVFRRAALARAGGVPLSLRLCGDWMMWVNILLHSDILFTPQPLNFFRHHSASVRSTTSHRRFFSERRAIEARVLSECAVARRTRQAVVREVAHEFVGLVRTAPAGARWREFREKFSAARPVFQRAPGAAIKVVLNRIFWTVTNRLAGRHRK